MRIWIKHVFGFLTFLLVLPTAGVASAYEGYATNTQPLSFGVDQPLIDLNKLEWAPLEHEGVPLGPEIAVLRGDMAKGPVEAGVRLQPTLRFPATATPAMKHIWIKGDFTYVAENGDRRIIVRLN
jgi:hypothetical protein